MEDIPWIVLFYNRDTGGEPKYRFLQIIAQFKNYLLSFFIILPVLQLVRKCYIYLDKEAFPVYIKIRAIKYDKFLFQHIWSTIPVLVEMFKSQGALFAGYIYLWKSYLFKRMVDAIRVSSGSVFHSKALISIQYSVSAREQKGRAFQGAYVKNIMERFWREKNLFRFGIVSFHVSISCIYLPAKGIFRIFFF